MAEIFSTTFPGSALPGTMSSDHRLGGSHAVSGGNLTLTTAATAESYGIARQTTAVAMADGDTATVRYVSTTGTGVVAFSLRTNAADGTFIPSVSVNAGGNWFARVFRTSSGPGANLGAAGPSATTNPWLRFRRSGTSCIAETAPDVSGAPGSWTELYTWSAAETGTHQWTSSFTSVQIEVAAYTIGTIQSAVISRLGVSSLLATDLQLRFSAGTLSVDSAVMPEAAGGGGGSLVAAINWDTATGNSNSALTDSANADSFDQMITCGGAEGSSTGIRAVMNVVNAASAGITPWPTTNAMRLTARGEAFCGNVEWSCSTGGSAQNPNGTGGNRSPLAVSQSHYARLYFRVQTGFRDNHGISYNAGGTDGIQFVPLSIDPAGGGPTPTIKPSVRGLVTGYPLNLWVPGTLGGAANNWACTPMARYRYEWHLEYITPVRFRIWPRLYDSAGTLLFDVNTYFRVDQPATAPNSLAAWYDIGGANRYFEVNNAELAREFSIGHEGPGGSTDTGAHWFLGAVAFSTSDWVGA